MRVHPLGIALAPLAAVALAAPLIAQESASGQAALPTTKPGSSDIARVTGGSYRVEPTHSQIFFAYDHMGLTRNEGMIAQPTGTWTLDPKQPEAARVSITVPLANISTGVPALDEHLAKADFFDTAKYPTATFVSTGVKVQDRTARIAGNLTIKGVTKPVVLDAEFYSAGKAPPQMGGRENIGFTAETRVKRSDFGMGYGVPIVDDEIPLRIVVAFEKV